MSSPAVSVILPTTKRPKTVGCAIASVLAQSFSDFELLVCGYGVGDDTRDVVANFDDSRIRWFDIPAVEGNSYVGVNAVLREAAADCIAYLSDADLWLFDHLERCIAPFADSEIELVYSKPAWVSPDGQIFPVTYNLHVPSIRKGFLQKNHSGITLCTVIHRKSCFQRHGYWDESLQEAGDWDMWTKIVDPWSDNFYMIRESTTLHFHRTWQDPEKQPLPITTWRAFYHGRGKDLPTELALPLPKDTPPQHVYWHLIHEAPEKYAEKLRIGLEAVQDLRLMESPYPFPR